MFCYLGLGLFSGFFFFFFKLENEKRWHTAVTHLLKGRTDPSLGLDKGKENIIKQVGS